MERNTFNISFYVHKTRVAKNGEVPVVMRVTINGQRVVTSVNLKVDPKKWNAFAGKSVGNTRKDYELNTRIDTIRARIIQVHRQMELDGEPITAQKVIDKYLGRDDNPVIMLLDLFREHNEKCRKLSGNGMAPGTVERYETSYKHTAAFLELTYGKKDIPVSEVNHKFITNIKFKLEEIDRDFLEDHEIRAIIDKRIDIERLAQVRDAFVFCIEEGKLMFTMHGSKLKGLFTLIRTDMDGTGKNWLLLKKDDRYSVHSPYNAAEIPSHKAEAPKIEA